MNKVNSKNNIPIRLTRERWFHITEEHSEMAGYYFEVLETVQDPEGVYEGNAGALLAVRKIKKEKFIVVVYKETSQKDGFIIASFLTKRENQLKRRQKIWPKQPQK